MLGEELERLRSERDAAQAAVAAHAAMAAAERSRADRAEGELDGLKLGTEHLHDRLAQAERAKEEAQRQAIEGTAAAKVEKQAREAAEAALARVQGRGLWARLRNRR